MYALPYYRSKLLKNFLTAITRIEDNCRHLVYSSTLKVLLRKIGVNRTYVSKAIKSNFNGNFSDFVNRYRIEDAVKLMKSQRKEDVVLKSDLSSLLGAEKADPDASYEVETN